MQTKKYFNILILALAVCLASCAGKDGDPGIGYAQSVQYGNVKATLSGKRPTDNIDFTAEQDFKYAPTGNSPANASYVYTNDNGNQTFYVARYLSGVSEHYNDNYLSVYFEITPAGVITYHEIDIYTTVIIGTKYFGISEYNYSSNDDANKSSEIKDFKYDVETGKLKFTFTYTAKESNSTGNDLTVTGTVDANVLVALNDINGNGE